MSARSSGGEAELQRMMAPHFPPPICTCAASDWMSRCRAHGWRGKVDAEHLAWLLVHYPADRDSILESAEREGLIIQPGSARTSSAPTKEELEQEHPMCEGTLEHPHRARMQAFDYFSVTQVLVSKCPVCGALAIEAI